MKRYALLPILLVAFLLSFSGPGVLADDVGQTGVVKQETLIHKGMSRSYLTFIPLGDLPSPGLVIVLHGSMGTGQKMREMSANQFDRLAVQERCIVVYPDGYKKHWNDCRIVPGDAAHKENIDDVGFISAIIDACEEKWHVDTSRVYAVGFSNGGHMCFRLASEIPDKISGIAAIGASMPEPDVTKCPSPSPGIPVMIVNGTDDPISPFDGGMVRLFYFITKGRVASSFESARMWLKVENRTKGPVREQLRDGDPADKTDIEKLTWPGDAVGLYIVHGGGHTIPGGAQYAPAFFVGRASRDMSTAQEAWRFFQEHPKSR